MLDKQLEEYMGPDAIKAREMRTQVAEHKICLFAAK